MNIHRMGWAVSGALALVLAGMVGSGFQAQAPKFGSVDLAKVFTDSDMRKTLDSQLRTLGENRKGVLDFLAAYRAITSEDAIKFHDLSIKDNQSAADKAEIERIQSAAKATDQKYRDLQTKPNPTDAEKTQLNEFTTRVQNNTALIQKYQEEFSDDVQQRSQKMRSDTLDKVKAAVADVAKKQGYTVILSDESAPYTANDVTAEALAAMNKK